MEKLKAFFFVIKDAVKKHLKLLIALLVVIILLIIILSVIMGNPKKTVTKFIKAIEKGDTSTISKLIDKKALYVFGAKTEGDLEDFEDEYRDFEEDEDDDYEEFVDTFDDELEKLMNEVEEEGIEISLKEIKSSEKVKDCKNVYKVKAKASVEYEGEEKTFTIPIYVMKSGFSYKIIGTNPEVLDNIF